MPTNFKLPTLPAGAKWGFADDPADVPSEGDAQDALQKAVGSVYRQVAGPVKPPGSPSLMSGFLKPVATKAASLVPHTPMDLGLLAASAILGGPGGPAAMVAEKMAPGAVPALEAIGATGLRRLGGMAAVGAGLGALTGQGAGSGAIQGLLMQLPGEAISKISRWGRMSAQASDLAKEDPEKLGQIVSNIIPNLKDIRTANDFHAAFNNEGADRVASQAYRMGMDEVKQAAGGQPIRSQLMSEMRGAGAQQIPGSLNVGVGRLPGGNIGQLNPMTAEYSLEDAMYTLKRLRKSGWNEEEIRAGLNAMDAREAADQLANEIKTQLPPQVADKFTETDGMYARARSLINYISDPKLLKQNGELNIPRLQQKFKSDGYGVRQSLQMTADAMALKDAIFRGSDKMAEDVPGEAGKIMSHFRMHFGIVPVGYGQLPKLGQYAGREPYGLTPAGGTAVADLLKRGLSSGPVTLAAPSESE